MAPKSTPMMRAFAAGVRANIPTLLIGDPGEGKSAKITKFGEAWGRYVECIVGSVREPADYLGLPFEKDEATAYLAPAFVKRINAAKSSLLFLDELNTSSPTVQKVNLRLLQERYAGDEKIEDHVAIVAAMNPPESAADGWDLPAPVANRMMHINWVFDADEWLNGVLDDFASQPVFGLNDLLGSGGDNDRARAKGLVTAFLRAMPQMLKPGAPTDPIKAGQAWPSPRSWSNVMSVLGELDPHDEEAALLVVKGCVGEDTAVEFFAWVSTADLHNPEDVMKDPSIVEWNKERPDRLFALTGGITSLVLMRGDIKSWEQGVRALTACAKGLRPDVALPGMRTLLSRMPKDATITAETQHAFADLFQRTGQWQAA